MLCPGCYTSWEVLSRPRPLILIKLYTLLSLPCTPWTFVGLAALSLIGFCRSMVLKICTFLSGSKDLCTRGILRYVNTLLSANKIFGIHGIFPEALIRSGLDFRAKLSHRLVVFSSLEARQVFGVCLLVISAGAHTFSDIPDYIHFWI